MLGRLLLLLAATATRPLRKPGQTFKKPFLADIGKFVKSDHLEGVALGPDGTLWLVSDDNVVRDQATRFIALAVR